MLLTSHPESYRARLGRAAPAPDSSRVSLRYVRLEEAIGTRFRTDRGTLVTRAFGCLVEPRVGDLVMVGEGGEAGGHVLQVIERPVAAGETSSADLSLPGCEALSLSAKEMALQGSKSVAVRSGGDVDVVSTGGTLRLAAADIVSSAARSMVQLAQHWMSRAAQISLDASALLRTHGRHQVMTASQEMRIDGERIHMG